jgi:D-alanyl-D-alanine carboxypeptidase/D-alanyl-D-alanine-endopeptidase (penicillin-binding protein 4)
LKLIHTFSYIIFMSIAFLLYSGCSCDNKTKNNRKTIIQQQPVLIDTALRSRLVDFANRPRVEGQFGFHVYDLTADKPVYGFNERLAMSSASCLKLLTGVAGLHLLGTNYMYRTCVYTRGRVERGVLKGDVAFQAGLDPQLQGPDLIKFAKAVKDKGISKIGGKLYVDLTLTEPVESEPHWYPWDLSFSRYGLLYKGHERVVKELKAVLRARGISVADSQVVMDSVPRDVHCIYRYYRPINHVIRRMWKNSSNTQATAMLYTIGHKVNLRADPVLAGVDYLRTFLSDTLGLKDSTLVIHDGCGLCTHNHLSPLALTTVLRFGYQHRPIYNILYNELSIAGVDGTLRREMTGVKTRGKIRAKTGTLSHPYGISSLAGYCKGSNGHLLAFAIMDTEMSVLDARVLQRKLCEAMVK